MSLNVGNLIATLGLDKKEFDTEIDGAQTKTAGFASGFASRMSSLAVPIAAVGIAVAGAATYGISKFADFEQGMNEVFTLVPDASAEMRDKMIADVKAISSEMGILPEKTVPALYQAISAGVPPDNVFAFLETAQKAAIGGVTDLTTAVDGITSVTNAYGTEILSATEASDLMFTAVKLGKTDFSQLSNSLFNVIPTASALDVAFGDVTAAIAALTAQGTPTSVATTQMRQMFVELSKEGSKTADLFKTLTGKSFKEFIAGGGNVQDALQILETHAEKTGVGVNDLFSSVEAGSAALGLTGKGTEMFSKALDEMDASTGATETAFETMEGGINRQLEKLSADFNVIVLDVAEGLVPLVNDYLLPAIRGVVDGVKDLMSWFGVASTAPNPLIDTIRDHLIPVFEFFQEKQKYIIDWWSENSGVFIAAWENIAAFIQWVIGSVIVPLFEWAWPYISQIYSGALDVMLNVAKLFASILAGDWESAGEALIDITKGFMGILNGLMGAGWDAIATGIEWVGQGIMNFIYDVWGDIVQYIETQINNVIDLINGMIESIESVTSAVGITLPRLQHVKFQAEQIKAPELKIQRWGESEAGKLISEYIARDETDDDDPDAEFEDEDAPAELPASALPVVAAPVIPAAPAPIAVPPATAAPATEIPDIETGAPVLPDIETTPTVTVPAIEVPLPVLVDWGHMPAITFPAPTIPAAPSVEPPVSPPPEGSAPTAPDVIVPEMPPVKLPAWPVAPNQEGIALPVPAPRGDREPVADRQEEDDPDAEFEDATPPAIAVLVDWANMPPLPLPLPSISLPGLAAFGHLADLVRVALPDIILPDLPAPSISLPGLAAFGHLADLVRVALPDIILPDLPAPSTEIETYPGAVPEQRFIREILPAPGEQRIIVEIDGNVLGESMFRTWNRRTGGALNG